MNVPRGKPLGLLALLLFLVCAAGTAGLGQLYLQDKRRDMIKNLVEVHGFHLSIAELALRKDWHHILTDLSYLSKLPDMLSLFQGTPDGENAGRRQVEQGLSRFLESSKIYHKIRVIDRQGKEILKIRNPEDWGNLYRNALFARGAHYPQTVLEKAAELQDKSQKPYFYETIRLKPGEIYVSPFDLNTEFDLNIVELPTIRFATPLYDADNAVQGILVLSYNGMHLLNNFKSVLPLGIDASLLNNEGYWFYRKDDRHLFGFDLHDPHTFGVEFPEIWPVVKSAASGGLETRQGLFLYREFRPFYESDQDLSDRQQVKAQWGVRTRQEHYVWKIVIRVSQEDLNASMEPSRRGVLAAVLATMLLQAMFFTVGFLWLRRRLLEKGKNQAELAAQQVFHELQNLAYQNLEMGIKLNHFLRKLLSLPWFTHAAGGVILLPGDGHEAPRLAAVYPGDDSNAFCLAQDPSNCSCRALFLQDPAQREILPRALEFSQPEHANCLTFPAWSREKLEAVLGITLHTPVEGMLQPEVGLEPTMLSFLQNTAQLLADVITRHHAMEEIGRLQRAVEQSPAAVVITTLDGRVEYVNARFTTVSGYSFAEVRGRRISMLKSGKMSPAFYRDLWETILSGREWRGEFCNRHKDGHLFWESALITPIRNAQGLITNFLSIKEDITLLKKEANERQNLERQLRQAQKMESIGHLTGGIAHDFNNILAAIKGFTELALTRFATDEKSKLNAYLRNILTASDRARDLIAQMLVFSRGQETEAKRVMVEPLVKEVIKLLRATLPATISITQDFSRETHEISADPVQLHQVLMNLFVNARDAMNGKGRIDVRIQPAPMDQEFLCSSCHSRFDGQGLLMIAVKDDGSGMPLDIQAKIFEPFFTTKEVGQGTGMGLSVVHGIIHAFKGHVVLQSEPGQGTEFQLFFQEMNHEVSQAVVTRRVADKQAPELTGHVLLVDDEAGIVEFLKEFLEGEGFTVTAATNSLEALVAFESNPQKFDLVMTDQTMPDMTGLEMARRMMTVRPGLPVILCTGYSKEVDESTAAGHGIRKFLKKPIETGKLVQALQEIYTSGHGEAHG